MQSTESAISHAQMQLLLVGDNEDFSYLRELLSQAGDAQLGLDCANSTEEALVRLARTPYDLLPCDYNSADGTALRLLHEVRKDGAGPPVIFLSDHMNESHERFATPSMSTAKSGSVKRQRIRCGSFGTRWSSRRTWL